MAMTETSDWTSPVPIPELTIATDFEVDSRASRHGEGVGNIDSYD
jgi:hypothetical protein